MGDSFDSVFDTMGVETEPLKETSTKLEESAEKAGMTIHYDPEKDKNHKIFYGLTVEDREQAVIESLVPEVYKNSAFDIDKIKDNLKLDYKEHNHLYKVINFNEYTQTCNGIISAIRMKKLPTRSYIIGAPNGFGKTSFVTECIITLRKHNFRVVPYITLSELNTLRIEEERRMLNPFFERVEESNKYNKNEGTLVYYYKGNKGYAKTPKVVIGCYSYSEYINADCLFVALTSRNSKEAESQMLKQLLNIRAIKGLPTIVTMMESLDIYTRDPILREYVWDEIISYRENENCYDRLYHVSTYKQKTVGQLNSKGMNVDSDTGIVG